MTLWIYLIISLLAPSKNLWISDDRAQISTTRNQHLDAFGRLYLLLVSFRNPLPKRHTFGSILTLQAVVFMESEAYNPTF